MSEFPELLPNVYARRVCNLFQIKKNKMRTIFGRFRKNVKHTRDSHCEFLTAFVSILFYSMRRAIVMNLSENIVLFFRFLSFFLHPTLAPVMKQQMNRKKFEAKNCQQDESARWPRIYYNFISFGGLILMPIVAWHLICCVCSAFLFAIHPFVWKLKRARERDCCWWDRF